MSKLESVKSFAINGLLATKEIQDLGKALELGTDLVPASTRTESTDPSWYPQQTIVAARRMAQTYLRLYLFETQVRDFVDKVLREAHGDGWFEKDGIVPENVRREARRRKEEDGVAKYHMPRGDSILHYTSLTDLNKIINQNWPNFEDVIYSQSWMNAKFEDLRLTRNAVAHMGEVSDDDLLRLDVHLRDWNRQLA